MSIQRRSDRRQSTPQPDLFASWRWLVGPQIADVTCVGAFQDGTLWVAVRSPGWAVELDEMTAKILERCRAAGVREIRWVGLPPRLVP